MTYCPKCQCDSCKSKRVEVKFKDTFRPSKPTVRLNVKKAH
jgi:hypothetical protein